MNKKQLNNEKEASRLVKLNFTRISINRFQFIEIFLICCLLAVACFYTVHAQTVNASTSPWHAQETLLPITPTNTAQNNQMSTPPPAPYDEQLGLTFNQNSPALIGDYYYNVTAIAQSDSYGYGPAYLLNGLSNDGYWFQVGISYDWPHQGGGYVSGFSMNYEVFNSAGDSVYPTSGGGGIESFSAPVYSGDLISLSIYSNSGVVYMTAYDWNTTAVAYVFYSNSGTTDFVGGMSNGNGFFSGLMTEWYHVNPYYGDEDVVNYTENNTPLSSGWMWMDEWQPPNKNSILFNPEESVTFSSNPTQLQRYSSNGATIYGSAYQFTTGSIPEATQITFIPAGASNPLAPNDYFQVSYTSGGQNLTLFAQSGWTYGFNVDYGTSMVVSGVSADSNSSEEWVLNSQGASITIPAGWSTTWYYYDLLSQPVAYIVEGSGSISPMLTYYTAPSTSSSLSNPTFISMALPDFWQQIIWTLRGTTVSVSNNILGTSQDRWATPVSSWTITQADQIYYDISYYHQYLVTADYSTLDGSVPSLTPLLIGTQVGSSYQLPLTTSNQTTWLDENTQWFVANVTAPSGTEQWVCSAGNSGTVTQTISINPTYAHQYYLTVISPYSSTSGAGWYNAGSTAYASLASGTVPYGIGAKWTFAGWSTPIGGDNYQQSNAIIMNSAVTATAVWVGQYYLTVTSAYGSPSGTGWYNAGTVANFGVTSPVSVSQGEQYAFASWTGSGSGSYSGNSASESCQMNAPVTEIASWNTQYYLTVSSAYGSPTGEGWYNSGSAAYASVASKIVSGGSGIQYVLTGWGGDSSGSGATSSGITMNAPKTATASWGTQYYLTASTNFGTVGPDSGWQNAGSTVTIYAVSPSVTSGERYVWNGWTGSGSGSYSGMVNATNAVTMNGPVTLVASWAHQYRVSVASPYGSPSPSTEWFNAGADVTFSVSSPVPESIVTQRVCTGWTGTGNAPATGIKTSLHFMINQPSSVSWNWESQFILPMVLLLTGVPLATVIVVLSVYLLRRRQHNHFEADMDSRQASKLKETALVPLKTSGSSSSV